MHREGEALGIPTVLMEGRGVDIPGMDKRAYQRAQRVAIMNYWVYFNQNPVIDPPDLLVMDDAHLAEHCLHSLFSVEIDMFPPPGAVELCSTTEISVSFHRGRVLPVTSECPGEGVEAE